MLHRSPAGRRPHRLALANVVAATVVALSLVACTSSSSDAASVASTTDGASTTTTAATTDTTTTDTTETADGASLAAARPVEVHVPPSYRSGTPAPLLVLLHGYGTSGKVQGAYLRLTGPIDEAGMLYVQPDGTENQTGKRFWNATDGCCAGGAAVDDSAYLQAVIDHVKAGYDVDPKRVFVVGHSNGGFMAYRMACDHAATVAAVISLEGATYDDPEDCSPSEPVATLEVHGTADRTIAYDGGRTGFGRYPGAQQTVATWAAYDGCSTTPDAEPTPATRDVVKGLAPAEVTSFSGGCEPGGHAELWTQPDGIHIPAWSDTFATQLIEWLQAHPKP